jgi:hypothetical protein
MVIYEHLPELTFSYVEERSASENLLSQAFRN